MMLGAGPLGAMIGAVWAQLLADRRAQPEAATQAKTRINPKHAACFAIGW